MWRDVLVQGWDLGTHRVGPGGAWPHPPGRRHSCVFPVMREAGSPAKRALAGGGGAESSACDVVSVKGDVVYNWGGSEGPRDAQGEEFAARLGSVAVCSAAGH